MGRLEDLEGALDAAEKQMDEAVAANRKDDIESLQAEIDRIQCELHTYDDTWVPQSTDTDYNELG